MAYRIKKYCVKDLERIWCDIKKKESVLTANKMYQKLTEKMDFIADNKIEGHKKHQLDNKVYQLYNFENSFLIIYHIDNSGEVYSFYSVKDISNIHSEILYAQLLAII